ncbi:carbohydrate binding domain-containing protein [Candidatus Omnitrophota bacterium]
MKRMAKVLLLMLLLCRPGHSFAEEKQFDTYGGWTGLKGEATGWFHTEKIKDRWWIITPTGNAFWSLGVYCVRFGGLEETGTKRRPYREACVKKYGNETEWARITKHLLLQWGFNTIGDWSSETIYRTPGMPYVIGVDLPKDAKNVIPKGYYGYFPDVFSQGFRDAVSRSMEDKFRRQPYIKNDKWLLGYFLADEPSWYGSRGRRESLVNDFIRLDSAADGKKAWVEYLKSTYQTIDNLNFKWGSSYNSFDELLFIDSIEDSPLTLPDKYAFLQMVAEEFSRVLSDTFREYDQNHMILGSRPSVQYPEVITGTGKYSDILSTSSYWLNHGYTIDPKFSETVDAMHKYSKKPIMLGVLISGQDVGMSHGKVKTQRDRGISYWRYLARVASNPNIVGIHWFDYFDPPKKCYDQYAANWGLVNQDDEPYTEALSSISQANHMVYSYALGLTSLSPNFDGLFGASEDDASSTEHHTKLLSIPIKNYNFKSGRKNWLFQAWKGNAKLSIDNTTYHSDKASLKIHGSGTGWNSVGVGLQHKPPFALLPGYVYTLSAWIKTEGVEDNAFVRIKTKYRDGEVAYFGTPGVYGNQDWKYVETLFAPSQENETEYLGAQLVGKGTAWIDDIQLTVKAAEKDQASLFSKAESSILNKPHALYKLNNLPITNPGFEEGAKDWNLQAWQGKPRIVIDKRSSHSGNNSVKISGKESGWGSAGVAVRGSVNVNLTPQKRYLLKAWIKTEDVDSNAFVRLKIQYKNGNSVYFETNHLNGTGDWELASKEFRPKTINKIEYLACQLVGKGTAWFDDISIEEIVE